VFHAQTEPVLEFYKSKGKLTFVNGDQPVDKVAEELVSKIK
jgi:adenylate kinase family enzyme